MAEADTTATKAAPKKTPRKPDPMTRILNDVRAEMKTYGELKALAVDDARRRHYDGRAAAWGREYARTDKFDALLLSLGFEALACYPKEERYALVQLAAVILARIEKIDGGDA